MAGGLSLFLLLGVSSLLADQKLSELTVDGETYQNVTITSKSSTDLFITHSRGFANIKVDHLDLDTKILLGYETAKPQRIMPGNIDLTQVSEDPKVEEVRQQMVDQFNQYLGDFNPTYVIAGSAVIGAIVYLFLCFCFQSICKKAGTDPGIVVWLPVLQLFPLLKAAGMPAWWVFVFLLSCISPLIGVSLVTSMGPSPVLSLLVLPSVFSMIGFILWCFKICQARGMSLWLGILLLLPGISFFAFLYLAFGSSPVHDVERIERAKTERWSKAKSQDTSFFFQS